MPNLRLNIAFTEAPVIRNNVASYLYIIKIETYNVTQMANQVYNNAIIKEVK